ncbi:MAG: FHA domain-containing protein, partial [Anaerolineales bacterium]|nr:FHA domain-containing protein [Anaerolineales bacterium]
MHPAPFARLTIIEGPEVDAEYSLTEQRITLGRDAGATVRIHADGVSREHAILLTDPSGTYIEDQNSSNGTFINGVRISQRTRLNSLDRIALGKNVVLRFELAKPAGPDATLLEQDGVQTLLENQPGAPAGEAAARLTFQVGDGPPQTIPLVKAVTTIGRSPDNDVAIGLPFVSRQHARILLADGRFQLQILSGSANPVYVNEGLVSDIQELLGGESIRIGSAASGNTIELQFEMAGAATVPNMRVPAAPVAAGPAGTLLIDPQQPTPTSPPRLLVTVAGAPAQSYT